MKPPALPIAPQQYDPSYFDRVNRILTQYLNQEAAGGSLISQQRDVDTVMLWLGYI